VVGGPRDPGRETVPTEAMRRSPASGRTSLNGPRKPIAYAIHAPSGDQRGAYTPISGRAWKSIHRRGGSCSRRRGRFPLRHVDDYATRVPERWLRHDGVMLPMYQSEAPWRGLAAHEVRQDES